MKILVVGGGGREHALAWVLAKSPQVELVLVAPGNAGTHAEPGIENCDVAADNLPALRDLAVREGVDLTIVGPEAPLVDGLVDEFEQSGLLCFGPHAAAAQLEGSKSYAKAFMARHNIPTAAYAVFEELDAALDYVREQGAPLVVKADGLAAGKGVTVAMTVEEALQAVRDALAGNAFGEAGHRVVIEAFLEGQEASFIAICDGERALPFATSQDHKRIFDGDQGPNTGGMGAYSPAPVVTQAVYERTMSEVIEPVLRGMREEGHPYKGFLYAGLMIGADESVNVVEFNCRFGDPEAQVVLARLRSDFAGLCLAGARGDLSAEVMQWDDRAALGVVMAAAGYPGSYERGAAISGLAEAEGAGDRSKVLHAGTAESEGVPCTNGGRVLCVVGLGEDIADARACAYDAVSQVHFDGAQFRGDIGHRAIGPVAP